MFLILFEDDEQDDKEVVHTWIFWSSTVDIWKDLDIWTFYFEDDEQDEARGGENGSEFDILEGRGEADILFGYCIWGWLPVFGYFEHSIC